MRHTKRGGHHLIPIWLGGNTKQLLYGGKNWSKHPKLEKIIKKRMKDKFGLRIGGKGGSYEDIGDMFIENPGLQDSVFMELLDIYQDFDTQYGTELVDGLYYNIKNTVRAQY